MTDTCLQCGNPVSASEPICPYCGGYEREVSRAAVTRKIDVGHQDLTTDDAEKHLIREVDLLSRQGGGLLTVVHGYGSTGSGGAIARTVRRACGRLLSRREIRMWAPGEKLSCDAEIGRRFRGAWPDITGDVNWDRRNEGITVLLV